MTDPKEQVLTGEQAEVFDHQMDTDRELMEATDDCIAFRPTIEGEFSEYIVAGGRPPQIVLTEGGPDGAFLYDVPGGQWTAVVDLGRAFLGYTEASGMRMRLLCPPPIDGGIREAIREAALETAYRLAKASGAFKKNKLRKSRRSPARGFGS